MADERVGSKKIVVSVDGPYLVSGGVPIADQTIGVNEAGESVAWQEGEHYLDKERCGLCRCGRSSKAPYCDGTHSQIGFDGTETASREPYIRQAVDVGGPTLPLLDARKLCAEARFCDRAGGLWNLVTRCDDPEVLELVEEEAALCPAGRYTVCDADTGEPHEPDLEPSIGIVEDPQLGVSGPVWVRGRMPIVSADGTLYEVRNRVTLCRCGASCNKPFCDGSHVGAEFHADKPAE